MTRLLLALVVLFGVLAVSQGSADAAVVCSSTNVTKFSATYRCFGSLLEHIYYRARLYCRPVISGTNRIVYGPTHSSRWGVPGSWSKGTCPSGWYRYSSYAQWWLA